MTEEKGTELGTGDALGVGLELGHRRLGRRNREGNGTLGVRDRKGMRGYALQLL